MNILVITKRQYMAKDLIDNRYGRFREIPLELSKLGHNVTGVCLSYKNKSTGWHQDQGVRWRSFNVGRLKIFGLINFIFFVFNEMKKNDVLWACSDSFYGVIACFLGRVVNRPVVFDIYDNFDEFLVARLPIMRQLYHWAIRNCDAITCLSNAFKKYLKKTYSASQVIVTLEFTINKDEFRPLDRYSCRSAMNLPSDQTIIGTAGALMKIRDIDSLIGAFKLLNEKYPDTILALAGPRDIEIPDCENIIDLGILSYEEVPQFINSLDVAVVCYAHDNYGKYCFPQKTREFIACDIPIVAADVGALREIFNDHPEWRYEPGVVNSLKKAIEKRLTDKRTTYSSFPDWKDLAIILDEVLARVVEKRRANGD